MFGCLWGFLCLFPLRVPPMVAGLEKIPEDNRPDQSEVMSQLRHRVSIGDLRSISIASNVFFLRQQRRAQLSAAPYVVHVYVNQWPRQKPYVPTVPCANHVKVSLSYRRSHRWVTNFLHDHAAPDGNRPQLEVIIIDKIRNKSNLWL